MIDLENATPLMISDLVQKPLIEEIKHHADIRELFAVALASQLNLDLDYVYAHQSVGVYGGQYVIITEVYERPWVQPSLDILILAPRTDITIIRSL